MTIVLEGERHGSCLVTIQKMAQSGNPVGAVACLISLFGNMYRQHRISLIPRCTEPPTA